MDEINPETLLRAYAYGVFPMGEARGSDTLYWVDPELRGILPLDTFHVPKRLARTIKADPFTVKVDTAFRAVMEACAEETPGRGGTWINQAILKAYTELHAQGRTHSVECWQDDRLVGGLYGVSLGRAFFWGKHVQPGAGRQQGRARSSCCPIDTRRVRAAGHAVRDLAP